MSVRFARCGIAALVLLLFVAVPGQGLGDQRARSTDQQIKAQIEQRFFDAGLIGVAVDVHDRTVTLRGTVGSLWLKDRAIQQARGVRDVIDVVSTLTVARGDGGNLASIAASFCR